MIVSQSSPLARRYCLTRRPSSVKPHLRYSAIAAVLCGNTSRQSLCSPWPRARSTAACTSADPTPRPRQPRSTSIPNSPKPWRLASTWIIPTIRPPATATTDPSALRANAAACSSTSTGGSVAIPSRS